MTEYEIKPQGKLTFNFKELWEYRELFYFFTWRDIKVKYKQTVLGFLWAVMQPIVMTILFTLGFGKLISSQSSVGLPYPLFALSGFLLWNIFSVGLSNAGNSMITNANIIKKIYFPRLIIPVSSILVAVVDFLMAFIVYVPFVYLYDSFFNWKALFLIPLALFTTFVATFGLGALLAAFTVKYRDFRYVLPFFIQALLFTTPIIYPITIFDNLFFKWILKLNPMNAPIQLMRSALGNYSTNIGDVFISCSIAAILFILGLYYFRKTEAYFADIA